MKRRSVEGTHRFSKFIAEECHIFDLGGLLMDDKGSFTAAVEAFEFVQSEKHHAISALLDSCGFTQTMYMNCLFAQALGVPFYILAHLEGSHIIHKYALTTDDIRRQLICTSKDSMTETDFIEWWKQMKRTVQTKPYRKQLKQRAQKSYFDDLLETNGLKWGGNIDGYLVTLSGNEQAVSAIIENRFTNQVSLSKYDPNNYYSSGGGDYYTWLPLIILKNQMNIPLFLMTYSNRPGEKNQVGITRVLDQDQDGLRYMNDTDGKPIRPCDNIFEQLSDLKRWIFENLDESSMLR